MVEAVHLLGKMLHLFSAGKEVSGDFLAGGLYLQSRSATAGREIGFITGTTPTKRMVIDSSGNVGIGTDSPDNKLHLYHGTKDYTVLKLEN